MGAPRKRLTRLLEAVSGYEIDRFAKKSFLLVKRKRREYAWASYRAQIRSLIEKLGINLVIDVGANEGQFAQQVRSFYTGDLHSFEPVSTVFERLSAAASSDPRWHVHNFALGSQNATQTIHVSKSSVFSSLLETNDYCEAKFGADSRGVSTETIPVRRLDEVLETIAPEIGNKRIFLKLDTQGYDIEAFKGLGEKYEHVLVLQSEVSLVPIYEGMPHWTESVAAFERRGFGVAGMFPVAREAWRVVEYDCLLVRGVPENSKLWRV